MNILINNANALFPGENGYEVREADIYISGDKIVGIDFAPIDFVAEKKIDASGKLVVPGLINMHTHHYMSLFRNIANDTSFEDWLFNNMFKLEENLTPEDVYWGTMLSIIESIKTGTTCFNDMYIKFDSLCQAIVDSGIRASIGKGVADAGSEDGGLETLNTAISHIEKWQGYNLINFTVDPHAPYTCSADFIKKTIDVAKEYGLRIHTHLSESDSEIKGIFEQTGMSPIKYMDSLGMFEVPTIAAHCVKTTKEDWDLMAEKGVTLVNNPASNMKLGNGFAPVRGALDAGVNVCLGTDGPASNNTVNMFREMNIAGLLGKGVNQNSQAMTANEIIYSATEAGAKALGMADSLGKIAEGYQADLSIIDLKSPELLPTNDIASSLVYSAYGTEVETVIVAGNILMENHLFTQIDEELVYSEVETRAKRLRAAL